MSTKFKLLSEQNNTVLAAIERGPNAALEQPNEAWFPRRSVRVLATKGLIFVDATKTTVHGGRIITLTDLGREYRAWVRSIGQ